MNKLNKLSASHGAVLFLFRSLFQLAKVIFSSKSLTKSSTKMLPFNYLFSGTKTLLRVQVFSVAMGECGSLCLLKHLTSSVERGIKYTF